MRPVTLTLEVKPEVEASLLAQANARGLSMEAYLEQVLRDAAHVELKSDIQEEARRPEGRKSLAQLFAESPFRGLDLQFERDPDSGRPGAL